MGKKSFKHKGSKSKSNVSSIVKSDTPKPVGPVNLVVQEIKFAKLLAGNDPANRSKCLKKLKSWLKTRSSSSFPFSDSDFLRIWKGLFYCMWMSDKPLVQEQLAEDLASLLHCFMVPEVGVQFYGTFLKTLSMEWFGIDQWRIDKFMMLVRRMTRQLFVLIKKSDWDIELIKKFREQINDILLKQNEINACGLLMHFSELYVEEIAKVSNGEIPRARVTLLLKPFINFFATTKDTRLLSHIRDNIFYNLIRQSDMGREYQERYDIWKRAGFPTKSVDDIEITEEFIKDDDEDEDIEEDDTDEIANESTTLDPRAGMVSVVIPEIDFKPESIILQMEKIMFKPEVRQKNRQMMQTIIRQMKRYMDGEYPFTERNFPQPSKAAAELPDIDEKVKELNDFESDLYNESRVYKKLKKSLKKFRKNKRDQMADKILNGILTKTNESKDILEENMDSLELNVTSNGTSEVSKKAKKNKIKPSDDDEARQSAKKAKKLKVDKSLKKSTELITGKKSRDTKNTFEVADEWNKPLEDGEVEVFLPSRKQQLKKANQSLTETQESPVPQTPTNKLLKNPFAKLTPKSQTKKPKKIDKRASLPNFLNSSQSSSAQKRVKISLDKNIEQKTEEYILQVINSPQVPYDSAKKPVKSLLKPNLMPSPINPFYKKRMGLNFDE